MPRFLKICLIILLQCLIVFFVILTPLAWILRDGLGPDAQPSSGFKAIGKAFMTFYVGPALLILIPLAIFSGGSSDE